ncbi:MAG: YHS domain-containing protein [Neomegalonema sp.]|nr:YHS domain-containing protein [Neomegalonema sp.]
MRFFGLLRTALASLAVLAFAVTAQAAETDTFTRDGYALSGYDAVSYFKDSGPVKGDDAYTYEYKGAKYRFASADHRDAFAANPAKYAPAYGGFCAFGTAMGFKVPTDPKVYKIVDGKLYLNLNGGVQKRWEKDIPGFIRGAENNWPKIVGYSADDLHKVKVPGLTVGAQ